MNQEHEYSFSFWRTLAYDLKYPNPSSLKETRWAWLPLRCRAALNVVLMFTTPVPQDLWHHSWSVRRGAWYDEIPF